MSVPSQLSKLKIQALLHLSLNFKDRWSKAFFYKSSKTEEVLYKV